MTVSEFENFATEFTGKNIKILLPEDQTKYAQYHYLRPNKELTPCTKYGISFGGNIEYDFKTTKNIDSFLKSFVNQHISKYELKQSQYQIINGQLQEIKPKKEDVIKRYQNQNRVNKYFFYTTLYGIGMFSFFSQNYIDKVTAPLKKYLKKKGIKYDNEFSDAGWAYRFLIHKDVDFHNQLLEDFEM